MIMIIWGTLNSITISSSSCQQQSSICRNSMRMSPWQLDKNVPLGRDTVATRPQHGDINHESERTGTNDGDGGRHGSETDTGAGVETDEGKLPPEQAHLETVSGRWGCGVGASAAGPTQRAAQAARTAGPGAGALWGGTLRRFRSDADGRTVVEGNGGGGSRDAATLAVGGGPAHGASPPAKAPAMAGAQAEFRGDGATGRVAPRLVGGARPPVRVEGDGGRRDQPDAGAVLRGGDHAGQLRCAGRLGAPAWTAGQPVCGSGQPLSLRRSGEHCRTTGRAMEALGVELDSGQPSASQGACGADERGAARPAGQSNAIGGDQRHGKREPFSGREVSAWVQPAVRPGGRQSPGRASSRAAELERSVELGRRARGARRLDGGVRGEAVSIGPAARGVELGAAEGDRADAAQRADASWCIRGSSFSGGGRPAGAGGRRRRRKIRAPLPGGTKTG